MPIVRWDVGLLDYLHTDHLGTPVAGSRTNGNVVWRETYTPYGELLQGATYNRNRQGFTGHIRDTDTGLTYMQARYYDPVIGRFLSNDPVGFLETGLPGQFNRYAYTWNNPVNANDPDGEFLNFVAKFAADVVLEVAIQVVSGEDVNIGSAVVGAATGLVDPTKTARKVAKLGKLANTARKANKTCCFVAGTLVETKDGLRPIEDIKVGDLVLSRNPETGETAYKEVTAFIPRHERIIWTVSLSGTNDSSESFETTDEHPWWVVNETGVGSWKRTDELTTGMIVTTADNQTMTITSALETERLDGTYNITVADFETYFVGENKVLVHNCKKTSVNQMQKKVEKGQAPKGIDRFDAADANQPNSKDHVHFKDGTSCNCDGTPHDAGKGTPNPTNKEKKFLNENGWKTPDQIDD